MTIRGWNWKTSDNDVLLVELDEGETARTIANEREEREKNVKKKLVCTPNDDKCRAVRFDSISVVLKLFFLYFVTAGLSSPSAHDCSYSAKLYQSKTIQIDWNCEYFLCDHFDRDRKWVETMSMGKSETILNW